MSSGRTEQAQALRACLVQLASEASEHNFHFCTLHLRVAILELDDLIETDQLRQRLLDKAAAEAATSAGETRP